MLRLQVEVIPVHSPVCSPGYDHTVPRTWESAERETQMVIVFADSSGSDGINRVPFRFALSFFTYIHISLPSLSDPSHRLTIPQ